MRPDQQADVLEQLVTQPDRAGIFTDFDGTLAPIVVDPAMARPLPGARDALASLAARYKVVGVISGRTERFLVEHLGTPGVVFRGIYGLEGHAEAEHWRTVMSELPARARATAPENLLIERKGLTVTLHYRDTPEHEAWARTWATATATDLGLLLKPARMSYELLPPVHVDKGTTLAELADGLDAACFIGDDRGDLDAFATLDRMRANGAATLKVAVRSDESPPDLLATADLIVDGPHGAVDLLRRLAPA